MYPSLRVPTNWAAVVPRTTMCRSSSVIPASLKGLSSSLDPADAAKENLGSAYASAWFFIGLVAAAGGKTNLGSPSALARFLMRFVLALPPPWSASE